MNWDTGTTEKKEPLWEGSDGKDSISDADCALAFRRIVSHVTGSIPCFLGGEMRKYWQETLDHMANWYPFRLLLNSVAGTVVAVIAKNGKENERTGKEEELGLDRSEMDSWVLKEDSDGYEDE